MALLLRSRTWRRGFRGRWVAPLLLSVAAPGLRWGQRALRSRRGPRCAPCVTSLLPPAVRFTAALGRISLRESPRALLEGWRWEAALTTSTKRAAASSASRMRCSQRSPGCRESAHSSAAQQHRRPGVRAHHVRRPLDRRTQRQQPHPGRGTHELRGGRAGRLRAVRGARRRGDRHARLLRQRPGLCAPGDLSGRVRAVGRRHTRP